MPSSSPPVPLSFVCPVLWWWLGMSVPVVGAPYVPFTAVILRGGLLGHGRCPVHVCGVNERMNE